MATTASTEISTLFGRTDDDATIPDILAAMGVQLQTLRGISQTQIASTAVDKIALARVTSRFSAGSANNPSPEFFNLGSGLTPLLAGLANLFEGDGGQLPAQMPYIQPPSVALASGFRKTNGDGASKVAYGPSNTYATTIPPPPAATQITVQVQAMDSQSFLDRSNDIAAAVRKAMLETSFLNDVIREV